MKNTALIIFVILWIGWSSVYAQYPNNTTLQQWTVEDKNYNDPQNANPIIPGYYADPTIIEYEGTFYIYATSDLFSWNDITKLGVWSSTDLKNWTCSYLNWPTKEQCKTDTGLADGVWAPSVVKGTNASLPDGQDMFYMYVTVGREIWVGVADHPLGPWKNARKDNTPLIRHKEHYYVETIDAECFIDDDASLPDGQGQAYLYWGSSDSGFNIEGRCLAVKLNKDMVSFDEAPKDVTPPYFFEAPYMLKKKDTYYLMYSYGKTWDKTYQVRYATGKTPFGPWQEGIVRPILVANEKKDRITSTGHHTMLQYKGKHYIVYHRFNTLNNYDVSGNLRQLAIDELIISPDGVMEHVLTTHRGTLPKVADKRKNLAFGAKASSSSDLDSICSAQYVNDENNGTLWVGKKSASEWIKMDFERVLPINEIEIFVEYPIYSYAYTVEVSKNGKDWKTIDNQTSNTKIGSPMLVKQKVEAQYVRITLKDNNIAPRPGIWEIKVY